MKNESQPEGVADLVFTAEMWQALREMPARCQWRILKKFFAHQFEGEDLDCKLYIDYVRLIKLTKLMLKKTKTEKEPKEESTPEPLKKKEKIKERKSPEGGLMGAGVDALTRMKDFLERKKRVGEMMWKIPTEQEVADYVRQRGFTFSAARFFHYYDAVGWQIADRRIADWRSLCDRWQGLTKEYEERKERRTKRAEALALRRRQEEEAREWGRRQVAEICRRFDEARANAITYQEYCRLRDAEKAQQEQAKSE